MDVETLQKRTYKNTKRPKRNLRKLWRKTIWPLIQLGALATVVVLAAYFGVSRISRPIGLLSNEQQEAKRVSTQLAAIKEDSSNIERRLKHLNSPSGAEQSARRLGYVKPGEITLVIPE